MLCRDGCLQGPSSLLGTWGGRATPHGEASLTVPLQCPSSHSTLFGCHRNPVLSRPSCCGVSLLSIQNPHTDEKPPLQCSDPPTLSPDQATKRPPEWNHTEGSPRPRSSVVVLVLAGVNHPGAVWERRIGMLTVFP